VVADEVTERERKFGTIAHLSASLGLSVPLGNLLGPLVVLLVLKGEGEFVEGSAWDALNFLTVTVFVVVVGLLYATVLGFPFAGFISVACFGGAIAVSVLVILMSLVFVVKAAVETSQRRMYEYPLSVEFV